MVRVATSFVLVLVLVLGALPVSAGPLAPRKPSEAIVLGGNSGCGNATAYAFSVLSQAPPGHVFVVTGVSVAVHRSPAPAGIDTARLMLYTSAPPFSGITPVEFIPVTFGPSGYSAASVTLPPTRVPPDRELCIEPYANLPGPTIELDWATAHGFFAKDK